MERDEAFVGATKEQIKADDALVSPEQSSMRTEVTEQN
jgi:hypothetical protein